LIHIIVGPLYFGMGYASWVISCLLLNGEVERPMTAFSLISLPIIAAAIMTQWDLVMDSSASTLGKAWVWHDGGGYFGVPLSNFLGWFAVTWCFFQGFALLAYLRRDRGGYRRRSKSFWLVPALLYAAAGLCYIHSLAAPSAIVTDGSGHAWSAADLRETTVIVMLFTMLRTSVLAIFRLFQRV
jgi:putative membrane protein